MHLKACGYAEALEWAAAWLAANPGDGPCTLAEADEEDELHRDVNKALAEKFLAERVPVTPERSTGRYLEQPLRERTPTAFGLGRKGTPPCSRIC
jgi:hypothetical protein